MWNAIATFVLKFRLLLIIGLVLATVFMGFMARKAELAYDFAKIIPSDDKDLVFFEEFQARFGLDDNLYILGFQDSSLFQLQNFEQYTALADSVSGMEGVSTVLSLNRLMSIEKNEEKKRFDFEPVMKRTPRSQAELDSLLRYIGRLGLYEGMVFNPETGANLMLIGMTPEALNSKRKQDLVWLIKDMGKRFEQKTGVKVHYSGVPYVRTVISKKVKEELQVFLGLSLLITTVFLFLFFRSFSPVLVPLVIIGMVVVWTMGTLGILGYKINILTGLLPPILVVIGIPNCIYLINKYHQEYSKHGDKTTALTNMVRKIGLVTLITNATTAIGFTVLIFTEISLLMEFGIVAGINIFHTFVISIILIPAILSYRKPPQERHIRHLSFPLTNRLIAFFSLLVNRYRLHVFLVTIGLIAISIVGILQIKAVSFMVDDLPEDSSVKQDLYFFESHFKGIMPLEVVVDLGKPQRFRSSKYRKKIAALQDSLATLPYISRPLSSISFLRAANQAFMGNRYESDYALPGRNWGLIYRYLKKQEDSAGLVNSFQDTTGQFFRVSLKVKDLGSLKMDSALQHEIRPMVERMMLDSAAGTRADVTGTTLIFIKGNEYLIENLKTSMLIAFALVGLIMALLLRNVRMIIISMIPNFIPLMITAGLMGFLGVPLKPSTVLVFSIAFGISVDDSIHFLAKYRLELKLNNFDRMRALAVSLQETGTSMIYTSVVLFGGFIIFVGSGFGGTKALGALTSTTLFIAMFTNLILLPCLLRTFDVGKAQAGEELEV